MNGYYGVYLLGLARGDAALADWGRLLLATELRSAKKCAHSPQSCQRRCVLRLRIGGIIDLGPQPPMALLAPSCCALQDQRNSRHPASSTSDLTSPRPCQHSDVLCASWLLRSQHTILDASNPREWDLHRRLPLTMTESCMLGTGT